MNRCDQSCIAWSITFHTDKGFDSGLCNHFVVVLAHPGFLAGNVGAGQHIEHEFRMIGGGWRGKWGDNWGFPFRLQLQLWHAVMEEFNGEVGNRGLIILHMENSRVSEGCNWGRFNFMERRKCIKGCTVFGLHCNRHAFLAFRYQNFPSGEACLLERYLRKINFTAVGVFCHFTDRRRKTPCAIVCDASDQSQITCFEHHINHLLLCDRVTDLNSAGRRFFCEFK